MGTSFINSAVSVASLSGQSGIDILILAYRNSDSLAPLASHLHRS